MTKRTEPAASPVGGEDRLDVFGINVGAAIDAALGHQQLSQPTVSDMDAIFAAPAGQADRRPGA